MFHLFVKWAAFVWLVLINYIWWQLCGTLLMHWMWLFSMLNKNTNYNNNWSYYVSEREREKEKCEKKRQKTSADIHGKDNFFEYLIFFPLTTTLMHNRLKKPKHHPKKNNTIRQNKIIPFNNLTLLYNYFLVCYFRCSN